MPSDPLDAHNIMPRRLGLKGDGIHVRPAYVRSVSNLLVPSAKFGKEFNAPASSYWSWINRRDHGRFGDKIRQVSLLPARGVREGIESISLGLENTPASNIVVSDAVSSSHGFGAIPLHLSRRSVEPESLSRTTTTAGHARNLFRRYDPEMLDEHQHIISGGVIVAIAVGVLIVVLSIIAAILYSMYVRSKRASQERLALQDLERKTRHEYQSTTTVKKGSDASTIWSSPLAPDEMPSEVIVIEYPKAPESVHKTTKPNS